MSVACDTPLTQVSAGCVERVKGCMDSLAENYAPDAKKEVHRIPIYLSVRRDDFLATAHGRFD